MTRRRSAGLLLHRVHDGHPEVLLGHMGGPYWARKDDGGWSVPKGEHEEFELPEDAARREFSEELGLPVPEGPWTDLGDARQPSGKVVRVFALAADLDVDAATFGTFEMEWPPRSGRRQVFPELDRAAWLDLETARAKLVTGQRVFLDRLASHIVATGE